jgi:hypothetical protein
MDMTKSLCIALALVGSSASVAQDRPLATATEAQQKRFIEAYASPVVPEALRPQAREASETVIAVLLPVSCGLPYNRVGRHLAPGIGNYASNPMSRMRYHPREACLTVDRFSDWEAPARNAIRFKATFVSEQSGETASTMYTLVKELDGKWLVHSIVSL